MVRAALLEDDALAALAHPECPHVCRVLGDRHDGDTRGVETGSQVFKLLPTVPGLGHHLTSIEREYVAGRITQRSERPPLGTRGVQCLGGATAPPSPTTKRASYSNQTLLRTRRALRHGCSF